MKSDALPTIWTFNEKVTNRLFVWSGLSMALGLVLQANRAAFWRAVGIQAMAWGAIDALIAWLGRRSAAKQLAAGPTAAAEIGQARRLRWLLWLNALLDLGYMAGGTRLMRGSTGSDQPPSETNAARRGHGWGILVQGAFLFVFDLWHALTIGDVPKPGND
ncbi:MAG: hypothetical protein KDD78_19865 [Caldilineaceae bacterium]|nr:hypothetical protein [Caldilineaceae bacterium]